MAKLRGYADAHEREAYRALAKVKHELRLSADAVRCADRWDHYFRARGLLGEAAAAISSKDPGGSGMNTAAYKRMADLRMESIRLYANLSKRCLRKW